MTFTQSRFPFYKKSSLYLIKECDQMLVEEYNLNVFHSTFWLTKCDHFSECSVFEDVVRFKFDTGSLIQLICRAVLNSINSIVVSGGNKRSM